MYSGSTVFGFVLVVVRARDRTAAGKSLSSQPAWSSQGILDGRDCQDRVQGRTAARVPRSAKRKKKKKKKKKIKKQEARWQMSQMFLNMTPLAAASMLMQTSGNAAMGKTAMARQAPGTQNFPHSGGQCNRRVQLSMLIMAVGSVL